MKKLKIRKKTISKIVIIVAAAIVAVLIFKFLKPTDNINKVELFVFISAVLGSKWGMMAAETLKEEKEYGLLKFCYRELLKTIIYVAFATAGYAVLIAIFSVDWSTFMCMHLVVMLTAILFSFLWQLVAIK